VAHQGYFGTLFGEYFGALFGGSSLGAIPDVANATLVSKNSLSGTFLSVNALYGTLVKKNP
jgi:hypothetical protein